jgi:D-psicose/D-tagatose/L-ribulose 3-epimerase
MKIGVNLLLWATQVTEEHYPQLELIKSTEFDGVEVPVFGGDDAHYHKLRRKLDELQLKASTVTIATPEANAISPDPSIRQAAVERLKTIFFWRAEFVEVDALPGVVECAGFGNIPLSKKSA